MDNDKTYPAQPDDCEKFEALKDQSEYLAYMKSKGTAITFVSVKKNSVECHVFKLRRNKKTDEEFWVVDIEPVVMSCGMKFQAVARYDPESTPVIVGTLVGIEPEIHFVKTPAEIAKFILSEGRAVCTEAELKNAIIALISEVRSELPEVSAYQTVGVYEDGTGLLWRDYENSTIVPSHPAAGAENKKMAARLKTAATDEECAAYFERLRRWGDEFPVEWRANLYARLGHGLGTFLSKILKERGISYGPLDEVGENRTAKTPRLSVGSAMFGDGDLHTSGEIDTRFKQQTALSRPGLYAIDEKLDERSRELAKAMTTSNVSAARGQIDGTVIKTPLVAVVGTATNTHPISGDDDGSGETARRVVLNACKVSTSPSANYAHDYAYLRGPDAPKVGRWLIDEALFAVCEMGVEKWLEKIRIGAVHLENELTFSKRAEAMSAILWCNELIMSRMGIDEQTANQIGFQIVANAKASDENKDEVQNFLSFITECEVKFEKDRRAVLRSVGAETGQFLDLTGMNTYGKFYMSKELGTGKSYLITQATIECWGRARGLKVAKQALRDTIQRLRLNGLDIDEPQTHRLTDIGHTWGALTNLDRLTTTSAVPLTSTYLELTKIYRDKNDKIYTNVSE